MSQASLRMVRQPMAVAARSGRRLEERLGLRFPGVVAFLVGLVWRLPHNSRLRQAFLRRAATMGCEAANRGDFEAAFVVYDQHVELVSYPRFIELGFDGVYRGRGERIRFQQRWSAEWGDFQFAPEELIDLGDRRVFLRGRTVGSGLTSGAGFDSDWAVLLTFSEGRIVREQFFFDREEALEAIGLRE
jgi:ketosteroid isomerase-like protein